MQRGRTRDSLAKRASIPRVMPGRIRKSLLIWRIAWLVANIFHSRIFHAPRITFFPLDAQNANAICVNGEEHRCTVRVIGDREVVPDCLSKWAARNNSAVSAHEHHGEGSGLVNVARPIRIVSQDLHLVRPVEYEHPPVACLRHESRC